MHRLLAWLAAALAGLLFACNAAAGESAAPSKVTTLLILIDGFGAQTLEPQGAPNLTRLAARGVRTRLTPVWPSISRPNHWALVTGLDARHSGVFHNDVYNPRTGRLFSPQEADFAYGEAIWATLKRRGRISGVVSMWTGAGMPGDRGPGFHVPFNWRFQGSRDRRAAVVLELLDQPPRFRADLLGLYLPDLDLAQHQHGVGSPEAVAALRRVDVIVGELEKGLSERGLLETTNIVVVADHGQMNVTHADIALADHIDLSRLAAPPAGVGGPVVALWPKPGETDAVYARLQRAHPNFTAYKAGAFPEAFACCHPDRTPPILLVADAGWVFAAERGPSKSPGRGAHGYDPRLPAMQALFVAAGPGVRPGARLEPVRTVDVYSFLAALLSVPPEPNNGSITPFCPVLTTRPEPCDP